LNLPWKVLKLATVLFCQDIADNPERLFKYTMPLSYFKLSEEIVALYGQQFASFYLKEGDSLEKQVSEYIMDTNNMISKSGLIRSKLLAGNYQQRSSTVFNLIDRGALESYLNQSNRTLIITEGGKTKKAVFYSIGELPKEETPKQDLPITFSQSSGNGEFDTEFLPSSCSFSNLSFSLANKNSPTLLIDLDAIAPSVAASLGIVSEVPGISSIIHDALKGRLNIQSFEKNVIEIDS
jgi:hypothetical protein